MSDYAGAPVAAAAGWYTEPSTGHQRYWTGQEWGAYAAAAAPAQYAPQQYAAPQYAPAQYAPAPSSQGEYQGGLVVAGYVLAVLMPLIGFILGIVTVTRPSRATSKHGIWIILLSVVAFVIFYAALASQRANSGV